MTYLLQEDVMKNLRKKLASTVVAAALMGGGLGAPAATAAESADDFPSTISVQERRDGEVDVVTIRHREGKWRRIEVRKDLSIERAARYAARKCDEDRRGELRRL